MIKGGYQNQILRINLSTGSITTEPLQEEMARDYLGGRGFVAKILWDEVGPEVEPFSEDNKMVFAPGPLSGTFIPCSGKIEIGCKSPVHGGYGDSNMGGHLSAEVKYAGYDAIIVEGRAENPTYIYIDNDQVELRDASPYWGSGALETEKSLKEELGEEFQIASIGPAGENRVLFACISHDFGRQAGRTGVGAVMGDKNIKALAVRGNKTIPLADPQGLLEKGKAMYQEAVTKPGFKEWTPYGTALVTDWVNETGTFPTRNFQTGYFEDHKKINGQTLRREILVTDKGCFGCVIPCGKYSRGRVDRGEFYVEGPEYETIALLGGNVGLSDIHKVAYANHVADDLGLDTISGGNVAAFAIECFEKGILTEEQVGRKLAWDDLDSVVYLLESMAHRRGVGAVLAQGVKAAAEEFGQGSEEFAIHIKGLEVSGYECRHAASQLLAYMTADIGAHHNRAWSITYDVAVGEEVLEGKAEKTIELQHARPLFDALGLCRLPWIEIGFELENYEEAWPLVTGMDHSWEDLIEVSERIWNLTRCYQFRSIPGFGRSWDQAPPRMLKEPLPSGPSKGKLLGKEKAEKLLDTYYALRGWDSEGKPTRTKLESLKLDFCVDQVGAE